LKGFPIQQEFVGIACKYLTSQTYLTNIRLREKACQEQGNQAIGKQLPNFLKSSPKMPEYLHQTSI
jgi:hypothetical protein